jgi:hypothetical protein
VDPVALVAGGREHVAERRPQPQRAVADRDHRGSHAAPAQIAQQLRPRLGRLAFAVSDRDELLGAVDPHAHDHQAAQAGLLQADPEVHPVRPDIDVVPVGQVTAAKRLVVGLPGGQQPAHRGRRQPGRRAEERLQRGHEVAGGQPI